MLLLVVDLMLGYLALLVVGAGRLGIASLARATESGDSVNAYAKNTTPFGIDPTEPAEGDYIVSQTPIPGKTVYATITSAISAIQGLPSSTTATIFIYPGLYKEQLVFNRTGTTVFRGYSEAPFDNSRNQVVVQNSAGVDTQADQSNSDSATLYSRATNIQLYNINLNNVFGQARGYASLGFAVGNNGVAAFYGCQITGNQGLIAGSIDFIWGSGSTYLLNSTVAPNTSGGKIAAMKRSSASSPGGLVLDQCAVTASPNVAAGSVFLGRPYNEFSRVAYVRTYLDGSIAPAGWAVWSASDPRTGSVVLGEYENYGPGAATDARVGFSRQLSDAEVGQFQLSEFFSARGIDWINLEYVRTAPFSL